VSGSQVKDNSKKLWVRSYNNIFDHYHWSSQSVAPHKFQSMRWFHSRVIVQAGSLRLEVQPIRFFEADNWVNQAFLRSSSRCISLRKGVGSESMNHFSKCVILGISSREDYLKKRRIAYKVWPNGLEWRNSNPWVISQDLWIGKSHYETSVHSIMYYH
jgi:hypothetical protein